VLIAAAPAPTANAPVNSPRFETSFIAVSPLLR
jgi:hypothetical protein